MDLRQGPTVCAACFCWELRGCLPHLPYCRLCAKEMGGFVEGLDCGGNGDENGSRLMQILCW